MRIPHHTLHTAAALSLACLLADCATVQPVVPGPVLNLSGTSLAEQHLIKRAVIDQISKHYFQHVALDTSLSSEELVNQLDPFSWYETKERYKRNMNSISNIEVRYGFGYHSVAGHTVVTCVTLNTSADGAGLLPGDEIQSIGGTELNGSDSLMSARLGTTDAVALRIYRSSTRSWLNVSVHKSERFTTCTPIFGMVDRTTGYVKIDGFNSGMATTLIHDIDILIKQGMECLIIDLQDNPGGYVSEALRAANFFINTDSVVISERSVTEQGTIKYTLSEPVLLSRIPIAILVNNQSCSASELFSGIMQDLNRAIIIGQPTMGKGLVMQYFPVPNGDMLYLAVAEYLLPTGRCVQRPYVGKHYYSQVNRSIESCENFDHSLDLQIAEEVCTPVKNSSGTPLLGGEGIIPDVLVAGSVYPDWLREAIFTATVPFLQENAGWLLDERLDAFEHYEIPEDVTERALEYARAHDTSEYKIVTAKLAWEIPMFIKWYVAYYIWEDRGTFAIYTRNCAIVRRATSLLEAKLNAPSTHLSALGQ